MKLTHAQIDAIRRLTWSANRLVTHPRLPQSFRDTVAQARDVAGRALGIDLRFATIPPLDRWIATIGTREYDAQTARILADALESWVRVTRLAYAEIQASLDADMRDATPTILIAAERTIRDLRDAADAAGRAIRRTVDAIIPDGLVWLGLAAVALMLLGGRR